MRIEGGAGATGPPATSLVTEAIEMQPQPLSNTKSESASTESTVPFTSVGHGTQNLSAWTPNQRDH